MGHGLLGHDINVPGGGVVVGVVQAVGVHKVGVLHPQLLGPLVHQVHEGGDVPGHGHGQDVGGLVGGDHQQAVEQVMDGDLLPGHDVGGGGVVGDVRKGLGGGGDHGVHGQLPPADGLQGQQGGHDLGDAGGVSDLVCVLLVEDLVGFHVHQQGGGGVDGDGRHALVLYGAGEGAEKPGQER